MHYQYLRSLFEFFCMWIFLWVKFSWYSCSMWKKLGWHNWFWLLVPEGLSFFNPEGFCYSYALPFSLWVILVKIACLVPYTMFWKTPLVFSQSGTVIKYLVQIMFIYYRRSGNENICEGVHKCGIITNWKIYCVWYFGQDLKSSCAKTCDLVQKLEHAIERVYLHQCFGNKFFLA